MSKSGARPLGLGLATMIVAGNMIGSGVYLLPASLGAIGSVSILAWLCAIAAALVFAGVFAWLASLDGGAGGVGPIDHIARAFNRPAAFVAAVLYWVQGVLGNVALALAITGYLGALVPHLTGTAAATACTIAIAWLFVALNMFGARLIAWLEGWTLLIGLIPVLGMATIGWLYFDPALFLADWNVSGQPVLAVLPHATVLVLWAFLGLESASVSSELVADPRRTVPLATIGGVVLAALIYLTACTAITGILPASALAASAAPFADAAGAVLGASLGALIALFAALKAAGTLGGWVLLTSEAGRQAVAIGKGRDADGTGPSGINFIANGVLLTVIALLIAQPSIAQQFSVVINATVVVMLCFYAMAGAALVRLSGAVPPRRRALAVALGLGCIALVVAVIATQEVAMMLAVAALAAVSLLAWPLIRRAPPRHG